MSEVVRQSWDTPVTVQLGNAIVQASFRSPEESRRRDERGRRLGMYRLVRELFSPDSRFLTLKSGSPPKHSPNTYPISYADGTSWLNYTLENASKARIIAPENIGNDQVGQAARFIQTGSYPPKSLEVVMSGTDRQFDITAQDRQTFHTIVDETLCALCALFELDRQT